jgi:hypothetical protein
MPYYSSFFVFLMPMELLVQYLHSQLILDQEVVYWSSVFFCKTFKMVLLGSGRPGIINQSNSLLDVFYQEIKTRMLPGRIESDTSACVTILCHTDLDAICTLRIFVALLKSDFIPYEIIPIAGYADLKQVEASNVSDLFKLLNSNI